MDATEDAGAFTSANLARYDAVIWLSTTGDVLDAAQQTAFERYIQGGGGYGASMPPATPSTRGTGTAAWSARTSTTTPRSQAATVDVPDHVHPSTKTLPARWQRTDEWYDLQTNPRGKVHVLATLDESTYTGGAMGTDHPIAWCHYYQGGRAWYTGMGHADESFADPQFRQHLTGGILWAAGDVERASAAARSPDNYQKVVLDDKVASPMGMDIAPDGRVFYVERSGRR